MTQQDMSSSFLLGQEQDIFRDFNNQNIWFSISFRFSDSKILSTKVHGIKHHDKMFRPEV